MIGPEHYSNAERLQQQADQWLDADTGWMGGLDTEERLARRMADLADAQVHATLALAAAVAMGAGRADDHGMSPKDDQLWRDACSAGWTA